MVVTYSFIVKFKVRPKSTHVHLSYRTLNCLCFSSLRFGRIHQMHINVLAQFLLELTKYIV